MCYKSRGPTVISYWSKNESCVLYRSYPGQLRSFKRPGYLAVLPQKFDFFLATNLGWRSANAISYDLFKRTQEKYCLRCIFMLRNIVSRSCFCGNKIIRTFLFWIVRTFYLSIIFCERWRISVRERRSGAPISSSESSKQRKGQFNCRQVRAVKGS